MRGSFVTPPAERRDMRFVWSADTVGQGWGINPDLGGMRIYETMRQVEPDFFIHSGDTIYADNPVYAEARTQDGKTWLGPDGKPWRNLTIPEKEKVAETLHEFRTNYAYNLLDENLRRFNAAVPMYAQWDDHEVTNNWYWELRKDQDQRYQEGSVALLAARALRAFHDCMPTRLHPLEQDRLYTSFAYGPSLEVFRIDLRSYRGPNSDGMQTELSPEARIIGERQLPWLMQALKRQPGDLEGDRLRHADRADRLGRFPQPQGCRGRGAGRHGPAPGPRARVRRAVPLHPRPEHQERGLADRRRALHGRPPLRPEPRPVPGVRAVLGVRLRPAQRRHLRPERSRRHLRPGGWCS